MTIVTTHMCDVRAAAGQCRPLATTLAPRTPWAHGFGLVDHEANPGRIAVCPVWQQKKTNSRFWKHPSGLGSNTHNLVRLIGCPTLSQQMVVKTNRASRHTSGRLLVFHTTSDRSSTCTTTIAEEELNSQEVKEHEQKRHIKHITRTNPFNQHQSFLPSL